jgi:hypothetical protein
MENGLHHLPDNLLVSVVFPVFRQVKAGNRLAGNNTGQSCRTRFVLSRQTVFRMFAGAPFPLYP